jgi:hypothetical protein
MYGPQASDLASARMADRRRQAAQVGLENSVRHSRPARRRIAWSGQSITAAAGYLIDGIRSAVTRPRVSPSVN